MELAYIFLREKIFVECYYSNEREALDNVVVDPYPKRKSIFIDQDNQRNGSKNGKNF